MRIALISDCYWPRVNGVTVSVQTYRDELERLGHEVIILCPDYPPSRGAVGREDSVRRFRSMANAISKEDRLIRPSAFPLFIRTLERFNPDVVHINTEFTAAFAARSYAKLRGYPILVTSHTDYEDYAGNYITYVPAPLLRATVRFPHARGLSLGRRDNHALAHSGAEAQSLSHQKALYRHPDRHSELLRPQGQVRCRRL